MAGETIVLFKSFNDLQKYIKKEIQASLIDEVAEVIKDEIQSSISDEVYASYNPIVYKRRGYTNGGLGDKDTMDVQMFNDSTIKIISNAERNLDYKFAGIGYDVKKSFVENIVEGYGDRSTTWNRPRDFLEETRNNLKENKHHIEALKDSLEKKGIKTI